MSAILLTPPASEPLTLAETKAFLRVEHGDDDDVIGALIAGARVHVEAQTRRALISQVWRIARDCWPDDGAIRVVPAPLRDVIALRVRGPDGETHEVPLDRVVVDPVAGSFAVRGALPAPGGIECDVEVGYGETGADVPEPLRQAIRLLVAHWYENRSAVAVGQSVVHIPAGVGALLASYRVLSL